MAMRSLVGKLKALAPQMPRFGAAAPKDMLRDPTPVIDTSKFKTIEELNEALPALMKKKFKDDKEFFQRQAKAYDRVTYVIAGASVGGTIWFIKWFFDPLLD